MKHIKIYVPEGPRQSLYNAIIIFGQNRHGIKFNQISLFQSEKYTHLGKWIHKINVYLKSFSCDYSLKPNSFFFQKYGLEVLLNFDVPNKPNLYLAMCVQSYKQCNTSTFKKLLRNSYDRTYVYYICIFSFQWIYLPYKL